MSLSLFNWLILSQSAAINLATTATRNAIAVLIQEERLRNLISYYYSIGMLCEKNNHASCKFLAPSPLRPSKNVSVMDKRWESYVAWEDKLIEETCYQFLLLIGDININPRKSGALSVPTNTHLAGECAASSVVRRPVA